MIQASTSDASGPAYQVLEERVTVNVHSSARPLSAMPPPPTTISAPPRLPLLSPKFRYALVVSLMPLYEPERLVEVEEEKVRPVVPPAEPSPSADEPSDEESKSRQEPLAELLVGRLLPNALEGIQTASRTTRRERSRDVFPRDNATLLA